MALSCAPRRLWTPLQPLYVTQNRCKVVPRPTEAHRQQRRAIGREWRRVRCALEGTVEAVLEEEPIKDVPSTLAVEDRVVVLFKHDLRTDDHPGLHKALTMGHSVTPLYCLDPELLQPLLRTSDSVELLWHALDSLKRSLKALNSDLVIRVGSFASTLKSFAEESGATTILTEAEVDVKWRAALDAFQQTAPEVTLSEWTCSMRDPSSYRGSFREMSSGNALLQPVSAPDELPPLVEDLDVGELPEFADFKQLLMQKRQNAFQNGRNPVDPFLRPPGEQWTQWSSALTNDSLGWLDNYLSQSQIASNGNKSDLLEELMQLTEDPRFPGISFSALFSVPLSLGILSPRRVHYEAQKKQFIPLGNPLMLAAQRNSQSYDFHSYLANDILKNGCSGTPGASKKNFWRWGGILTEYSVAEPPSGTSKGTAVLVHGFGASCMHWRRNVDALTEAGYTVYCPSLPGYGRTQKLHMKYHGTLSTEFLTDFITDIIEGPVVLAGNSIGAFMATQTAAAHPEIVSGLILINPAGPVVEDYSPSKEPEAVTEWKPPAFVINLFSRALLFYLEKSAGRILKSVYPVQQENADTAFLDEILRASYDPNAIAVVKSVFFLQKPPPLNYLLNEKYKGAVLLLQGALDPLSDAISKADKLRDLCPDVEIQMMQAGHCSHDETPTEVNSRIINFLDQLAM